MSRWWVLLTLLVAGCGSTPYFEVGVGYQIDKNSDWYVRTERPWQCSDNYQGHFELGLDWGDTRLGYHHQSWFTCGDPFNSRPELYVDDVRLTHTFGGKK